MSTPLLDTHAHLTDPQFADDLPAILSRAAARNVSAIICVSSDTDDAADALALAAHHPCVHAAVGLHPETVSNITDAAASAAVARLAALLASHRGAIVAVGEIGLDHTPRVLTSAAAIGSPDAIRARQNAVFNACLRLAREHGLPVSVHSRGAGRHAVDAVCAAAHAPGRRWAVLHAFDGRAAHAERGAAAGCMFSVPPAVARGEQMQKLVRRLPLAALLLESDAPALAAVAGERNEPGEVVRALDMIAAQKGVPAEEAARVMDATARTVFPLVFVGDNGVR
jgi:TatD DNase family protein